MRTVQIATRVDEQQSQKFREIANAIGTTPSDALRMFIAAFISEGGFPYQLKVKNAIKAFENENEAASFATGLARNGRMMIDEQADNDETSKLSQRRPFSDLFGEWSGRVWMSDDFDEPLEDFKEYM